MHGVDVVVHRKAIIGVVGASTYVRRWLVGTLRYCCRALLGWNGMFKVVRPGEDESSVIGKLCRLGDGIADVMLPLCSATVSLFYH